ncbi:uncharacterized protein LOC143270193 isoform X2 [Peromyscus maniculatus bairdii]|uniref:uncharacterized protein LOC143270193 isoform X2 n=1 Tax=Peromyscus maniculatus bairdii TaxID=230844 RepID=UPI003FD04BCC
MTERARQPSWKCTRSTEETEAEGSLQFGGQPELHFSQLEKPEMNVSAADLTRSTLMELNVSESRDVTSSSVSDVVVQKAVPPSCYCKKGKPSTDVLCIIQQQLQPVLSSNVS